MLRHLTVQILLIISGLVMFIGNQHPLKAQTFHKGQSYPDLNNLSNFHWQSLAKEDSLSYREVMEITEQYFKNNPKQREKREKQEESFKHYLRWKIFWQDRMTKAGHAKTAPWYANKINKDQD